MQDSGYTTVKGQMTVEIVVTDPLTGLAFNPPGGPQIEYINKQSVIDITLPILQMNPASPQPTPSLSWSIIGVGTDLTFDSTTPTSLAFDNSASPSKLVLPDMTAVSTSKTFRFDVKCEAVSVIPTIEAIKRI